MGEAVWIDNEFEHIDGFLCMLRKKFQERCNVFSGFILRADNVRLGELFPV